MRFIDYIVIALRNIWRQKLRSSLTIFAVVIGATSVAIMLALVTGARSFFLSQVEANGVLQQVAVSQKADVTDFNDASHGGGQCDTCVKLNDSLVTKIQAIPHVIGISRQLRIGMFEAVSYNSQKLSLNQMFASDANGILTNNILAGRDINASDKNGVVVITSDYADKFGFKNNYSAFVGKKVTLQSRNFYSGVGANVQPPPQCSGPCNNPPGNNSQPPTTLTATVVGVMDSSNQSQTMRVPFDWAIGMDEQRMYQVTAADQAAQQAAQAACSKHPGPCNVSQPHTTLVTTSSIDQNGYDQLTVKVDNSKNAKVVAVEIRKFGVGAADAESMINSQLTVFNIIGLVLGGIGGIALVVAAIGVVNTMIMAILERTREIGVMRAVGAKRSTVSLLFTFEASLLGFWGGVFGVAIAFGLTRVANVLINKQLASNSVKAHNIISLPPWLIVIVIAATTVIGMLAGLYPAHRAAKLDPVEALRYE